MRHVTWIEWYHLHKQSRHLYLPSVFSLFFKPGTTLCAINGLKGRGRESKHTFHLLLRYLLAISQIEQKKNLSMKNRFLPASCSIFMIFHVGFSPGTNNLIKRWKQKTSLNISTIRNGKNIFHTRQLPTASSLSTVRASIDDFCRWEEKWCEKVVCDFMFSLHAWRKIAWEILQMLLLSWVLMTSLKLHSTFF